SAQRRVLAREITEVETEYGTVRMKHAATGAFAPEYDDCRRIAREKGLPLKEIIAAANLAYRKSNR
ncbi:MAG: nickel insertion protein, partial [Bryobacteraceae bacterium]